jgi:tRNA (mo5U34)-methyltransferase
MESVLPSFPVRLKAAERSLRKQRARLFGAVRQDPDFQSANISLYDFDILENIELILELLDDQAAAYLDNMPNRTMIDIGCASGDLGFAFEEAGFSVALLDRSHVAEGQGSLVRQDAPLVASIIAKNKGSRAVIFDEDIDDSFDPKRVIEGFARSHEGDPQFERFGLGVMLGVLYHLKSPYSVIEKLGQLCDHLIVGTWVADCLPDRQRIIKDEQVVYLLTDRQLAADPTNYWIFTARSLRVLVERCGWQVLAEHSVTNPVSLRERLLERPRRQPGVSPPDNVKQRVFMLLKRRDQDTPS